MDHSDLPQTPMAERDPFAIEMPMFELPNVDTLRTLMQAEQHAVQVVHNKVRSFMEPGMSLVGADGKPIRETGAKLNEKVTDYLHELLTQPTIAEEWVHAPSTLAKNCVVTGASFQIAYMIYQEFGRLLNMRAKEFLQVADAVMVLGMNAIHNRRLPVEAYERSFQAKHTDPEGNPIMGQAEAFRGRLMLVQDLLFQFLVLKKMATAPAAPDQPYVLTVEGVRLLNHLLSVLGSTESMKSQGPALMQEVMGAMAQGEDLSQTEVEAAMADPNANLPEA